MNRHIKSFLTFTGGAVTGLIFGGVGVIAVELSSEKIRNALKKAFIDWFDEWLFPEKKRKVTYTTYYDNERTSKGAQRCDTFCWTCEDIIFDTTTQAEKVLDALKDIAKAYGNVTVADFYDLCGLDIPQYNLTRYGWSDRDVQLAKVFHADKRGNYFIHLPRALHLSDRY